MFSNLTALSLLAAASAWAAGPGPDSPLIGNTELRTAGMYNYWQAQLPISGDDSLDKAYLVDAALYVFTTGGSVFALAADTGLVRWATKLTERDYQIYRPSHVRTADGAGPVVIPTTTTVFLFDRFSGDLTQSFAPAFAAGSSAVGFDGILFLGSADSRFYSLMVDHPRAIEPFKLWTVQADGPITAAPVLYDSNKLLFASQGGTVYSCRAVDKTLYWTFRTGGPITADPFVDAGGVYVASMDRSLYKLHRGTGRLIWRVRMPRRLTDGPVAVAHTVYQYCLGNGLTAIDAATGREKWRVPEGKQFVANTRNGAFVWTSDGKLVLVDADGGEVGITIDARAVVGAVSNAIDDSVYLLGGDGRVQCARLETVPYLRRQQVIAARQRLNVPPQRLSGVAGTGAVSPDQEGDVGLNDPLRSRRDARPK